jgi:beta-N-acetylhexosaminidase
MNDDDIRRAGALLTVGLRGCRPGDPVLESDLDVCVRAGVGGVILFDVDVPAYRAALGRGAGPAEARWSARRNITGPGQLSTLIGYLRTRLGDDLVVMIDQEGGHVSRLRPELGFAGTLPTADVFASLSGWERSAAALAQAELLSSLGIDVNLAPVVDVAVDPESAVVARERSFGRDPRQVLGCAQAVIAAHRGAGVASCLKHFPGLGSVVADTHERLPTLDGRYDAACELAPYRELIQGPHAPEMVMAAHVVWPDRDPERPASRSPAVLTGVLRDELGFDGVVATDSLDMGAAQEGIGAEAALVEALAAGADVLLYAANLRVDDFDSGHPALRLARAVAQAVERGLVPGGWDAVEARRERLSALRRKPQAA